MRTANVLVRGMGLSAVALASIVSLATDARAFEHRTPPILLHGDALQAYFSAVGDAINLDLDQLDAQVWRGFAVPGVVMEITLQGSENAPGNSIGVYNTGAPDTRFPILPAGTPPGCFAIADFHGGNLVVTVLDYQGNVVSQTTFTGVNAHAFGFYISGAGGTFFSEDALNPGRNAQILTYAGTGVDYGTFWLCFEDTPYATGDQDFDDAVLLVQPVNPVPINGTTWGRLKSLYRK